MKRSKQPNATVTAGYAYVTLPQAHELFRKKMPKKNESVESGTNEFIDVFLKATEALVSTQQSFTFNDLSNLLRPFQLEPLALREIFTKWTQHLEQCGKLETIRGCYDDPVYLYH